MKCCQSRLHSDLCHWFCFSCCSDPFLLHIEKLTVKMIYIWVKCTDVPKRESPQEAYYSSAVCQYNILMHNKPLFFFSFFCEFIDTLQLIGRLKLLNSVNKYMLTFTWLCKEGCRGHLPISLMLGVLTDQKTSSLFKSVSWLILPLLELLLWFVTWNFWSLGVPGPKSVHIGFTLVPNVSVQ